VINMLVNMIEMLKKAKEGKYAVAHFNFTNLEIAKYILEECQSQNSPVIMGVSDSAAKYMGGFGVAVAIIKSLISGLNLTIPVAIHLDHGPSVEVCKEALEAGFTSVMIDASKYELEENIAKTSEVVEIAKKYFASVEAEIGHIGGTEDNVTSGILYADVDECIELASRTGINAITPALGSVHGPYVGEPNLEFSLMEEIGQKVSLPLVLHGASGIPEDQIKKAIACGTCKINIDTEIRQAWRKGVGEFIESNPKVYDPRKIIGGGEKGIKEVVRIKILLFGSNEKA
jgi:fructose-1,6-bisphosphate aldolase, class II, various bacterial and amitochondriate protist